MNDKLREGKDVVTGLERQAVAACRRSSTTGAGLVRGGLFFFGPFFFLFFPDQHLWLSKIQQIESIH